MIRHYHLRQLVCIAFLGLAAIAFGMADCNSVSAQTIDPAFADSLTLSVLAPSNAGGVSNLGNIGQMVMHPDGEHLFVASYTYGIVRYDYGKDASGMPTLSNATEIWRNDPPGDQDVRGSIGLAFHQDPALGTVLYFNQAVPNVGGWDSTVTAETGRLQTVRRMTDTNGDGIWGGAGEVNQAILDNIQVNTAHQIDNFVVRGNSLFMGIGSQTVSGNNEAAYNGTISWIEDLTQLDGDTTTANLAGFDTPAGNGLAPMAGTLIRVPLPRPTRASCESIRPGSQSVRTGLQGIDRSGDVWFSMNQKEEDSQGGVSPDELHHTSYQADHGFPKWYQTDGDMRNADQIGPTPPNTAPEQAFGVDAN